MNLLPFKKADQVSSKNFLKSMLKLDKKGIMQMNSVILLKTNQSMLKDALKNPDWKTAMDEEMKSIEKNET